MNAPLLILAVGNPSRGDDALGPLLLERLHAHGVGADGQVELLTDYQLQVEHSLDLLGRSAVLFVDAARPGTVQAAHVAALEPLHQPPTASHALDARALLGVACRLHASAPPSWMLAIEGTSFGLGEALSSPARQNLETACTLALAWLHDRLATLDREAHDGIEQTPARQGAAEKTALHQADPRLTTSGKLVIP